MGIGKQVEPPPAGPSDAPFDVCLKTYFDFTQAFGRSCFNSEPYAWACFHMLIGAMKNIRATKIRRGDDYLDPRIHLAYLAGSGEGKGVGASFVTKVARKLGLRVYNATDFTDAALIGTIRSTDTGEPVIHKGLLSGQTNVWIEEHGAVEQQDIDILLVSEASKVLDPRPGPSDALIMNSLQIAMNTFGTSDNLVTKKLAEGPSVSYPTDVTLFLTTFPPVTFADVVLKRGLFQRTLTVVKETHHEDRVQVTKQFFQSFNHKDELLYHNPVTGVIGEKTTDEIVGMVVETLKAADRWARSVNTIAVSEAAAKRLEKLVIRFQNQVKDLSPFLQAKIHEFISRLSGHLVKLAAHVAILNMSETIEEEHVLAIEKIHAPERFEELITYLSNNVEEPKEFTARIQKEVKSILQAQKKLGERKAYRQWPGATQGWRMRQDIEAYMSKTARLPLSGAKKMLDRHIVWGHVQSKKHGKATFCRVSPSMEQEEKDDRKN